MLRPIVFLVILCPLVAALPITSLRARRFQHGSENHDGMMMDAAALREAEVLLVNSEEVKINHHSNAKAMAFTKTTSVTASLEITFWGVFFAEFSFSGSFGSQQSGSGWTTTLEISLEAYSGVEFLSFFKAGVFINGKFTCEATTSQTTAKPDGLLMHVANCLYAILDKKLPSRSGFDDVILASTRSWEGLGKNREKDAVDPATGEYLRAAMYKKHKDFIDVITPKFKTMIDAVPALFESNGVVISRRDEHSAVFVEGEEAVYQYDGELPFPKYQEYVDFVYARFSEKFFGTSDFGWHNSSSHCPYVPVQGFSGTLMCSYLWRAMLTPEQKKSTTKWHQYASTDFTKGMHLAISLLYPELVLTGTTSKWADDAQRIAKNLAGMAVGQPWEIYSTISLLALAPADLEVVFASLNTAPIVTKIQVAGSIGFKVKADFSALRGVEDSALLAGEASISVGKSWLKEGGNPGSFQSTSLEFSLVAASQALKVTWVPSDKQRTIELTLTAPLADSAIPENLQTELNNVFEKVSTALEEVSTAYAQIVWEKDVQGYTKDKTKSLLKPLWDAAKAKVTKAITDNCNFCKTLSEVDLKAMAKKAILNLLPGTFSTSNSLSIVVAWETTKLDKTATTKRTITLSLAKENKIEFKNELGNPKSVAIAWTNTAGYSTESSWNKTLATNRLDVAPPPAAGPPESGGKGVVPFSAFSADNKVRIQKMRDVSGLNDKFKLELDAQPALKNLVSSVIAEADAEQKDVEELNTIVGQ